MTGNDALAAYGQYHKALALALAGDFVSAEAILAGGEKGPLHLNRSAIVAHAEILAQLDREADAITLLDGALASGVPDAPLIDLRDRLAAGEEVPFDQITSAKDGAAEAFLTLADALNTDQSQRVALVHARIAQHIRPDLIEAQLLAAEILEAENQFALATDALAGVPETSPWFVTAQIRRANTQRAAGDPDAGIATLAALAASNGDQIEVQSALGDALRMAERFPEAVDGLQPRDRAGRRPEAGALAALLYPRHRQRARRQLAGRRGRFSRGAEDRARPAAGAELSRLQPRREARGSRRGAGDDREGDQGRARGRLHHRLPRLGALPSRPLPGGGEADAARGRADPRRSDHQRSSRRRALDGRPQARGRVPVAAGALASARPRISTWTGSA